jgi:hypothetical protein
MSGARSGRPEIPAQLNPILFLLLAHQWTLLRTARDLADIYSLWRQYSPREQLSPLLAVPLPPGFDRLATSPVPRGSATVANTIGMTEVACFAENTGGPAVTMTSTLTRTNSDAISAKRSVRPSAQRISIATVRPSIQPSSPSRSLKAETHWPAVEAVGPLRNPIVGGFPVCCVRATSGHAAAAVPISVIKSRRLIVAPGRDTASYRFKEIYSKRQMSALGQKRTRTFKQSIQDRGEIAPLRLVVLAHRH